MTDNDIIAGVLERESGTYTDLAADRGGPTRWGITQATLAEERGKAVTPADVAALTRAEAFEIYRTKYVVRPGFENILSMPLRALLVDCEVNHRPGVAVRMLQAALGVEVDGKLGPKTIAALGNANVLRIYLGVCRRRATLYGSIISHDHTQAIFALGWMNRLGVFIDAAPLS